MYRVNYRYLMLNFKFWTLETSLALSFICVIFVFGY